MTSTPPATSTELPAVEQAETHSAAQHENLVISVRDLGKYYRLGQVGSSSAIQDLKKWISSRGKPEGEVELPEGERVDQHSRFWALRNFSMDVNRGEVVGIVGRNGSGKSTLLKLLSSITAPSTGHAWLRGRVASLLEVGTGFHPELSGRENIFLNGAILGMKHWEIEERYEDIVKFAEVAQFIDTPVKRYSSGMFVRLAFSVAAHLEPEILIVDEVLAVGDIAFQRKCLGKMEEVGSGGRTILFVSHNMQAVRSLCTRAILLNNGCAVAEGDPVDVTSRYLDLQKSQDLTAPSAFGDHSSRRGSGLAHLTEVRVTDQHGQDCYEMELGQPFQFHISFKMYEPMTEIFVRIMIFEGEHESIATTLFQRFDLEGLEVGRIYRVRFDVHNNLLRPGFYPLTYSLNPASQKPYDLVNKITRPLLIKTAKSFEELGYYPDRYQGPFTQEFQVESIKPIEVT